MTMFKLEQIRRERQRMEPTSLQERQLLAMREYYKMKPIDRLTIVDQPEPLEKSRLYGPFDAETLLWVGRIRSAVPSRIVVG